MIVVDILLFFCMAACVGHLITQQGDNKHMGVLALWLIHSVLCMSVCIVGLHIFVGENYTKLIRRPQFIISTMLCGV